MTNKRNGNGNVLKRSCFFGTPFIDNAQWTGRLLNTYYLLNTIKYRKSQKGCQGITLGQKWEKNRLIFSYCCYFQVFNDVLRADDLRTPKSITLWGCFGRKIMSIESHRKSQQGFQGITLDQKSPKIANFQLLLPFPDI